MLLLLATLVLLAAAKPSVTGIDTSKSSDLDDLSDFLSGKGNGSSSSGPLAQANNTTNSTGQLVLTPNADFFQNSTAFGEFFQDFYGSGNGLNSSWLEHYIGYVMPSPKAGRHNYKPVLIDGPDF